MNLEVCILAGGLSTRLGRDKARLKLGGVTMLARVRAVAKDAFGDRRSVHVRVIRKDQVRRCGPLGGVVTALRTSQADAVLFLACDMPLISPALLQRLVRAHDGQRAVFVVQADRVGFPFILLVKVLVQIEGQISAEEFSLHALARLLRARRMKVSARCHELFNVNTPADVARAEQLLGRSPAAKKSDRLRRLAPSATCWTGC